MNDELIAEYLEFKRAQAFRDDGLTIKDLNKKWQSSFELKYEKEEVEAHTAAHAKSYTVQELHDLTGSGAEFGSPHASTVGYSSNIGFKTGNTMIQMKEI